MNRRFFLVFLSLLTLVIFATRVSSKAASDEDTLKQLELDSAKHIGMSDADIAFGKSISADHLVFIDPLGHVYDNTPADNEKMALGMRKSEPDVKNTSEIHDIKVRISGDTAVVSYSGTYNSVGHKDPRYDVPNAKFAAVDTWQKQNGQWKQLVQASVSTEAIPASVYTLPPPGQ
jgi:ketosteroid isomerase-like protein